MALSARQLKHIGKDVPAGAAITVLDIKGQAGILRTFGANATDNAGSNGQYIPIITIEIDGVEVVSGTLSGIFTAAAGNSTTHGQIGIPIGVGTLTEYNYRLVNMPFTSSLKIKYTATAAMKGINIFGDYAVDI